MLLAQHVFPVRNQLQRSRVCDRDTTKLDWVDEKKQNRGLAKPKYFAFDQGSLENWCINLQVQFLLTQ